MDILRPLSTSAFLTAALREFCFYHSHIEIGYYTKIFSQAYSFPYPEVIPCSIFAFTYASLIMNAVLKTFSFYLCLVWYAFQTWNHGQFFHSFVLFHFFFDTVFSTFYYFLLHAWRFFCLFLKEFEKSSSHGVWDEMSVAEINLLNFLQKYRQTVIIVILFSLKSAPFLMLV